VIIAAGLTPAWQQILRFDGFHPGEVNRAIDAHWCASGKVLNVAIALAHLGAPCEAIALVGGPPLALIEREFEALGIPRHWVQSHGATRTCTTILNVQSGQTTELVENAAPTNDAELLEFAETYARRVARAQIVILAGSLPSGTPANFYRELLAQTPCRAILDVRGPELIEALACRPFLVKPNREELGRTVGRELTTDDSMHSAMRQLNAAGAKWVVVTNGNKPLWVSSQDGLFRITPPQVTAVNPIGSGDCLAAGIAWGLTTGESVLDAIRLGVAAAVENVAELLPARIDPKSVRARSKSILVQAI